MVEVISIEVKGDCGILFF